MRGSWNHVTEDDALHMRGLTAAVALTTPRLLLRPATPMNGLRKPAFADNNIFLCNYY